MVLENKPEHHFPELRGAPKKEHKAIEMKGTFPTPSLCLGRALRAAREWEPLILPAPCP